MLDFLVGRCGRHASTSPSPRSSTPSSSAPPRGRRIGRRHRRKASDRAITPTEKIWMDGELVGLDKAQNPRAHPQMHLRLGVFGRRRIVLPPPDVAGVGVGGFPPARPHRPAFAPPGLPSSTSPSRPTSSSRRRASGAGERPRDVLHPGPRLPRLRRDGLDPMPSPVQVAIAALAVGHLPRRRRCGQRGLVQDQLLAAPRPQTPSRPRPRARHVRQLVPGQGGGVEGRYDAAMPAHARRKVSECTGENIFVVLDGRLVRPHTSDAGASRDHARSRPEHRTRHGSPSASSP